MKKLMTVASVRLALGFCFIVSLFVFGNIPAVKAEDTSSLEGEWATTSPSSTWDSLTIVKQDGGYYVTVKQKPNTEPKNWAGFYEGNATQIMTSRNLGDRWPGYPAPVVRELTDKITFRYRFTLSSDGRSAEFAHDDVEVYWNQQTGQLDHYEMLPFYRTTTLVRVSQAASVKKTETSAIAAVVARGEFYILTKDGRKLTGKDVNKITLEEGTKVVTGNNGRVQLLLPDETVFTVGANSNIVIDKFVYDNDLSPKTIIANMSKGVFRWVTAKAFRKDQAQMQVNLPVGIIGIRGTDFETTVKPNGGGSIVLYFGQLEITEKKTGFKFLLQEGQKVTFGADGTFSRPMKGQ